MTDKPAPFVVQPEWRIRPFPGPRIMGLYLNDELRGETWREGKGWCGSVIAPGHMPRLLFADTEQDARAAVETATMNALGGKPHDN